MKLKVFLKLALSFICKTCVGQNANLNDKCLPTPSISSSFTKITFAHEYQESCINDYLSTLSENTSCHKGCKLAINCAWPDWCKSELARHRATF